MHGEQRSILQAEACKRCCWPLQTRKHVFPLCCFILFWTSYINQTASSVPPAEHGELVHVPPWTLLKCKWPFFLLQVSGWDLSVVGFFFLFFLWLHILTWDSDSKAGPLPATVQPPAEPHWRDKKSPRQEDMLLDLGQMFTYFLALSAPKNPCEPKDRSRRCASFILAAPHLTADMLSCVNSCSTAQTGTSIFCGVGRKFCINMTMVSALRHLSCCFPLNSIGVFR